MSLFDAFKDFKSGTRKSTLLKSEEKSDKEKQSEQRNKDNADKAKAIKDNLKENCEACKGTGVLEETADQSGRCLSCTQCLGRGFIKKRHKPDLRTKKRREGNLVGKKCKKRIVKLFLDGLTTEEICDRVNLEAWLITQVIMDLKDKLEQNLNKQN